MTWEEFNTQVRVHLPSHGRRQGAQSYIDALIKAAVIDLQRSIDRYRIGHHDIYADTDLTTDGYSSKGDVPDGRVTRAWLTLYDVDEAEDDYCNYRDLELLPYEWVQKMQCGETRRAEYYLALDKENTQFWVSPKVEDTMKLHIEWDGTKTDWDDADEVPFDEKEAECVANYVDSLLALKLDHDGDKARVLHQLFIQQKRSLFSEAQSRARLTAS